MIIKFTVAQIDTTRILREPRIKDPQVAKPVSETMKQMWSELDRCLELVRERCSTDEFNAFVKATRTIGCGIVMDVMERL